MWVPGKQWQVIHKTREVWCSPLGVVIPQMQERFRFIFGEFIILSYFFGELLCYWSYLQVNQFNFWDTGLYLLSYFFVSSKYLELLVDKLLQNRSFIKKKLYSFIWKFLIHFQVLYCIWYDFAGTCVQKHIVWKPYQSCFYLDDRKINVRGCPFTAANLNLLVGTIDLILKLNDTPNKGAKWFWKGGSKIYPWKQS